MWRAKNSGSFEQVNAAAGADLMPSSKPQYTQHEVLPAVMLTSRTPEKVLHSVLATAAAGTCSQTAAARSNLAHVAEQPYGDGDGNTCATTGGAHYLSEVAPSAGTAGHGAHRHDGAAYRLVVHKRNLVCKLQGRSDSVAAAAAWRLAAGGAGRVRCGFRSCDGRPQQCRRAIAFAVEQGRGERVAEADQGGAAGAQHRCAEAGRTALLTLPCWLDVHAGSCMRASSSKSHCLS